MFNFKFYFLIHSKYYFSCGRYCLFFKIKKFFLLCLFFNTFTWWMYFSYKEDLQFLLNLQWILCVGALINLPYMINWCKNLIFLFVKNYYCLFFSSKIIFSEFFLIFLLNLNIFSLFTFHKYYALFSIFKFLNFINKFH